MCSKHLNALYYFDSMSLQITSDGNKGINTPNKDIWVTSEADFIRAAAC